MTTYSTLNGRRVCEITVPDIAGFLHAATTLGYPSAQLVSRRCAVDFARQSEVTVATRLGVVAAAGSAWVRVTDTTPIGVWCGLQAWSQTLSSRPTSIRAKMEALRSFPGFGQPVWDFTAADLRVLQDWAVARGQEGVEISLDGCVVKSAVAIPEFQTQAVEPDDTSVCIGVHAIASDVLPALQMQALLASLQKKLPR